MKSTDISTGTYSIRQLMMKAEKNRLLFDYPIQRPGGQWKRKQESDLIHSLGGDFPIPAIYLLSKSINMDIEKNAGTVNEEVTIEYVLDGKQRISTALNYINGLFSVDKATPTVFIDDEEYNIAGKKFDALDFEVQEMIQSRTLITYTINSENVTDEEIESLFFRMNNGTALSIPQKSKPLMGTEWAKRIVEVGNHDVFEKKIAAFSPAQLKSEGHLIAIMQSMMMMDSFDYKNVSQKIISDYGQTFKDDSERKLELLLQVDKALDYLVEVFNKKEQFLLKKVHFPMTVLTAIEAIDRGIGAKAFADWAVTFKEACKAKESITHSPTNYMEYSKVGTTDRPKADGRLIEMKRHFNEYIEIHNIVDTVKI